MLVAEQPRILAEAKYLPARAALGKVRHIDVEDRVTGQRIVFHPAYALPDQCHRGTEILPIAENQRDRERRQAQESAFHGGRDRSGIKDIIAEICAVVDSRNDHIRLVREEPGHRHMDAVCRRPVHVVDVGFGLLHPQWLIQSQ